MAVLSAQRQKNMYGNIHVTFLRMMNATCKDFLQVQYEGHRFIQQKKWGRYYNKKHNNSIMATITIEYDGRNRAIKQLIEVLFTLGARETVSNSTEKAQKQMVKESLSTAIDELHTGQARKNARNLFA